MAELGEVDMSGATNATNATATTTGAAAAPARRRPGGTGWNLLVWPALVFLAVLFLLPFFQTALRSVTDPGPANYAIFWTDPVYARSLVTTFLTALVVTVSALLIAYPYAYLMYRSTPVMAGVLTLLVILPFFTSLLVRTYAWTVWLQQTGVINSALLDLGVIDAPLPLMRNLLGVAIGMTHSLLPFMVFPIYASMRRISPALVPAARSLGATGAFAFRTVFLPLTAPGVISGSLIVFVMSLGYYVTPALLGSPNNAMLSELIVNQVEQQVEFGIGSAIGIVLLALTLVFLFLGTRVVRFKDIVTGGR
ncbi:putative spermidine/putrescine transport system permease protein [Murinocardiopsis flavida]|uniref:Putative spermidine/putrescine transport system permease protein n=1 Tax=Murinocardiopsis flavida TaxID=645275 RepID=A0A2P8DUJ8_9ACTN|nr:ABC transporter permease [Murinocardiopsis flavida]PSL00899.1 putative spermidine/putrescine transport system permease protein [Murinocardiopsis flavida]